MAKKYFADMEVPGEIFNKKFADVKKALLAEIKKEVNAVDTELTSVKDSFEYFRVLVARRLSVENFTDSPPPNPVNGEAHIVGTNPSGVFVGHKDDVAIWSGTDWFFVQSSSGDFHYIEQLKEMWSFSPAGIWVVVTSGAGGSGSSSSGFSVGSIQVSVLSETEFQRSCDASEIGKWVLADGRDVSGTDYESITSERSVPDLRGAYLQGAGANTLKKNRGSQPQISWNGGNVRQYSDYLTGRPASDFISDTIGGHTHNIHRDGGHTHDMEIRDGTSIYAHNNLSNTNLGAKDGDHNWAASGSSWRLQGGAYMWGLGGEHSHGMDNAGIHSHRISGGGDIETKPNSFAVNYFIKIIA